MVAMVNYSGVWSPANYTLSHQEPAQYIYFSYGSNFILFGAGGAGAGCGWVGFVVGWLWSFDWLYFGCWLSSVNESL